MIDSTPERVARIRCILAACIAGAVVLGACGGQDTDANTAPSTITILVDGDERALGPAADEEQKLLVFLPMVRGYSHWATNRLAETRSHSADYREWTYHLRKDVRWHDGTPVTAADVAFSLELFRHPDILYARTQGVSDIESVEILDDHTLKVRWAFAFDGGLDGWTQFYPKHLLEDLDPTEFYEWDFWTHPIGNGPYRYVRHVPRTMIELEANPDFYAGPPSIERVILKFGAGSKVAELASGNVDVAIYLDPADVLALQEDERFNIYYGWAYTEPTVIFWNHQRALFADARVRRALTHAIDRYELRRILSLPDDIPVMGGLSQWDRSADLYRDGTLDEGLPYDPAAARRLLAQAGWLDEDGDGVRERLGVEARFTLLASQAGVLRTMDQAVFIQDQLQRVGVQMQIQPMARSVVNAAARSGDFDALISWLPNQPELLLRSRLLDGDRIGYRSPQISGLLEELVGELDPDRQDSLYAAINDILHRELPFTFLFPVFWSHAAHRRVGGLANRMHPLARVDDLWLEDGQ